MHIYNTITMNISTVTSQNQITIPSKLRKMLNLQAGDKIRFLLNSRQQIMVEKVRGVQSTQGSLNQFVQKNKRSSEEVWLERSEKSQ